MISQDINNINDPSTGSHFFRGGRDLSDEGSDHVTNYRGESNGEAGGLFTFAGILVGILVLFIVCGRLLSKRAMRFVEDLERQEEEEDERRREQITEILSKSKLTLSEDNMDWIRKEDKISDDDMTSNQETDGDLTSVSETISVEGDSDSERELGTSQVPHDSSTMHQIELDVDIESGILEQRSVAEVSDQQEQRGACSVSEEQDLDNFDEIRLKLSSENRTMTVSGTCYICLEQYQPGDEISRAANKDCPHIFHTDCIKDWILKMQPETPCPCCRLNFLLLDEVGKDSP